MIENLTAAAYVVAWLAGLAFFAMYVRTEWRAHPWGRHVMAFTVVVELILGLSLARRLLGDYPGRRWVLLALGWAFAAVMIQRVWVQWRGNRERSRS